jgi:sugar O-acyltransferase (sialic acid O-acetyltransferase NeuD family)
MSVGELVIVGAGAQAKYVIEICERLGDLDILGVVDIESSDGSPSSRSLGVPFLGGTGALPDLVAEGRSAIVCAADNRRKQELFSRVAGLGFELITRIHPAAVIATTAEVGAGTIINPCAVVQPRARVGDGVMIHAGVIVEHDNTVESFTNLGPGVRLAGWVTVSRGAYVYTGASVIPGKSIGEDAVVGAGAVVIDDVPARSTVAGVPARVVTAGGR